MIFQKGDIVRVKDGWPHLTQEWWGREGVVLESPRPNRVRLDLKYTYGRDIWVADCLEPVLNTNMYTPEDWS